MTTLFFSLLSLVIGIVVMDSYYEKKIKKGYTIYVGKDGTILWKEELNNKFPKD
jgi:hypothetical protein